jgi:hypothetical protein
MSLTLSPDDIKAIADEVVRQVAPMLKAPLPARVEYGGPPSSISVEIARVRASGLDLMEYFRQKAKTGRLKAKSGQKRRKDQADLPSR